MFFSSMGWFPKKVSLKVVCLLTVIELFLFYLTK